jgi:hypothetical protein
MQLLLFGDVLKTTWGSFETFWIPDEYQLSNVWRRIRDFAALLSSGIARKIIPPELFEPNKETLAAPSMRLSAGFSDGSIVSTPFSMVQLAQCPQNGRFIDAHRTPALRQL